MSIWASPAFAGWSKVSTSSSGSPFDRAAIRNVDRAGRVPPGVTSAASRTVRPRPCITIARVG
jgi:hypothetical protein